MYLPVVKGRNSILPEVVFVLICLVIRIRVYIKAVRVSVLNFELKSVNIVVCRFSQSSSVHDRDAIPEAQQWQ